MINTNLHIVLVFIPFTERHRDLRPHVENSICKNSQPRENSSLKVTVVGMNKKDKQERILNVTLKYGYNMVTLHSDAPVSRYEDERSVI